MTMSSPHGRTMPAITLWRPVALIVIGGLTRRDSILSSGRLGHRACGLAAPPSSGVLTKAATRAAVASDASVRERTPGGQTGTARSSVRARSRPFRLGPLCLLQGGRDPASPGRPMRPGVRALRGDPAGDGATTAPQAKNGLDRVAATPFTIFVTFAGRVHRDSDQFGSPRRAVAR